MFTKLRNKFLVLNMSMTSAVMAAAFAAIYIISYNNMNSEITKKLNPQAEMQTVIIEGAEVPDETENSNSGVEIYILPSEPQHFDNPENGKAEALNRRSLQEDNYSFIIQVDGNGEVLNIDSPFHMHEETYSKAADIAWNNKENSSTITLEDKQWRYTIVQTEKQVIQRHGKSFTVPDDKYQIMFLDVTMYKKALLQLLTTLLTVGLIMLFVIFIISFCFANRVIKPIAEAWERQKQFIADASHELKTPLSIIIANYDALLANRDETIQSQLKWFDYIKIGTDRMAKLINDMLSLAKVEDMRFEIQKVPFNMSNAIHDLILSMEAVVAEKDIKLICSIQPDIIIRSDSERIKQVIMILFDNAVKYTDKRGQIEISLNKSKRHIVFFIKNSGKGIDRQDLTKVFDRFYRVDSARTQETGSYGLGLSIAKTIIERLGGEIFAKSVENEYTTFTFTLGL